MRSILLPKSTTFRMAQRAAEQRHKWLLINTDTGRFLLTNTAPHKKWQLVSPLRLEELEQSIRSIDSYMERLCNTTQSTSFSVSA
jgi:hypothetical protein